MTRCCARVSLNGRRASSARVSVPLPGSRGALRLARARRCIFERELLREELVELETRPGRMRALVERCLRSALAASGGGSCRKCDGFARIPTAAAARAVHGGSVSPRNAGSASERATHELAQRVLRESGGRRIDRRQPVRQRRSGLDDLEAAGCTISRPKWPSRTSPNARTRLPGASAFCWLG